MRCRLSILTQDVAGAPVSALGGKQPAKKLAGKLNRANRLVAQSPLTPKRLRRTAAQLKSFAAQVNRGLANGRIDATLGTELATLASEAQAELAGLFAP